MGSGDWGDKGSNYLRTYVPRLSVETGCKGVRVSIYPFLYPYTLV